MIIIMLIELLFVYILMRFIEEIGISGSMLFYAILNVISAVIASGFGVGTSSKWTAGGRRSHLSG